MLEGGHGIVRIRRVLWKRLFAQEERRPSSLVLATARARLVIYATDNTDLEQAKLIVFLPSERHVPPPRWHPWRKAVSWSKLPTHRSLHGKSKGARGDIIVKASGMEERHVVEAKVLKCYNQRLPGDSRPRRQAARHPAYWAIACHQ